MALMGEADKEEACPSRGPLRSGGRLLRVAGGQPGWMQSKGPGKALEPAGACVARFLPPRAQSQACGQSPVGELQPAQVCGRIEARITRSCPVVLRCFQTCSLSRSPWQHREEAPGAPLAGAGHSMLMACQGHAAGKWQLDSQTPSA